MKVTTKNGKRLYESSGRVYPSVTTVINVLRREDLEMLRGVIGNKQADLKRDQAGNTGTVLHEICEVVLSGGFLPSMTLNPEIEQRVEAFQEWYQIAIEEVIGTNVKGIDEKYGYGYEADALVVMKGDKRPSVIDLKTGIIGVESRLQTAAYRQATKAGRRIIVGLKEKVRVVEYTEHDADFQAFLCCLHLYNWRQRYGK